MENATKAILIAGGILIGIMTLSLLVYAATATQRIEDAQYEKRRTEEIAKFNMEFEAYNKRRLYGIDVITVINKAIAHNKKMETVKNPDNRYYINVIFYTNETFKNTVTKKEITEGTNSDEDTITNADDIPFANMKALFLETGVTGIQESIPNQLGDFVQDETGHDTDFTTNLDFQKIFKSELIKDIVETNIVIDGGKERIYIYKLYSALTNFKKSVFTCCKEFQQDPTTGKIIKEEGPGIEYSDEGIIKSITFYQVKTGT